MPTIPQNPQHIEGRDLPDGYMTVSEFSRALGLRGGGLYRELKRHNIQTRKVGKYRAISIDNAERYIKLTELPHIRRVAKRPKGWLTTLKAAAIIGCSDCVVWRLARKKQFRAVRIGYTQYFHPDDVEKVRLEYNNSPLPGWFAVADTAKIYSADTQAIIEWLIKQGLETRKYRRPETKQIVVYAEQASLEQWLAHYQTWRESVRDVPTIREQVLSLLADGKAQSLDQLATDINAHRESIKMTINSMARAGELHKINIKGQRKPVYQVRLEVKHAA